MLDYGARWYDPSIGRFNRVDRFAEKYYANSSYSYTAGNPIKFIDVNGDSIDVNRALISDRVNGTAYTQAIINEWESISGLTITTTGGKLGYTKDAAGNPVVAAGGSATARNHLTTLIDDTGAELDISLRPGQRSVTAGASNDVGIDPLQIQGFINGTPATLNSNTMGLGMVALHETYHTAMGGRFSDPIASAGGTGPVVDRVNIIRSELDNTRAPGVAPYGQRAEYRPSVVRSSSSDLRFTYPSTTRRGRPRTRAAYITF